jgi:hypothetical protein
MTTANGHQNHTDSQPPARLEKFIDIIAHCIEVHSPTGPLGWRYLEEEDYAELEVYPTLVEIVGGEWDGDLVLAGFSLDVSDLLAAFSKVDAIHWSSQGIADDEGAHLSIEGIYEGHDIWLRILAEPPEDEGPGMQLDMSDS